SSPTGDPVGSMSFEVECRVSLLGVDTGWLSVVGRSTGCAGAVLTTVAPSCSPCRDAVAPTLPANHFDLEHVALAQTSVWVTVIGPGLLDTLASAAGDVPGIGGPTDPGRPLACFRRILRSATGPEHGGVGPRPRPPRSRRVPAGGSGSSWASIVPRWHDRHQQSATTKSLESGWCH